MHDALHDGKLITPRYFLSPSALSDRTLCLPLASSLQARHKHVAHLLEDELLVSRYRLTSLSTTLQHQVGADVVARHASDRDPCVVAELAIC